MYRYNKKMASFKIKSKTYAYDTSSFNEIISTTHIKFISNSEEIKQLKKHKELITKLNKIKTKRGLNVIKYRRKDIKFGRHIANKFSYQSMKKEVRNSLLNDNYIDIDMVNSHYSIIIELCKKFNYTGSIENIKKYSENRNEIIKTFMNEYKKSKKDIKDLFISILYGSEIYTPYSNNELLNGISKEILSLRNQVLLDNQSLFNLITKRKQGEDEEKIKWSSFSIYIQEWENRILEKMFLYLRENDLIENDICSLMYDGILIKKSENINKDVLLGMEEKIKRELELEIKLSMKNTDDKLIDLAELNKLVEIEDLGRFDINNMENLPNYESKKNYIEKYMIKVLFPSIHYIHVYKDEKEDKQEIFFISDEAMKKLLKPITSGETDDKGNDISFYQKWTTDINQKYKDKVDFIPFNPDENYKTNKHIFNLFTGFDKRVKTKYDKTKSGKILKPYFDLIYQVCGKDDDVMRYYLSYMAKIIKEPRKKAGICIEIRGRQGVGKNVSYIPIKNIIGADHFLIDSNPNIFFDKHSTAYLNKLLVVMDEVEFGKIKGYESMLKTRITEETITFNPKNEKMFSTNNYSSTNTLTNKRNGSPIDFSSGDRRYMIQKASDDYAKNKSKTYWTNLVKHFNKPEFIACLYDYFMDYDYSNINWIKDRPLTEEYKKSRKQFIPAECLFIGDKIIKLNKEDDDDEKDEEDILTKSQFYNQYREYVNQYNLSGGKTASITTFIRSMEELFEDGIKFDNDMVNINIEKCRETLIFNKHIDDELDEYKHLFNYKLDEDDDDYFNID
jgi:hypothetical protein